MDTHASPGSPGRNPDEHAGGGAINIVTWLPRPSPVTWQCPRAASWVA